MSVWCDAQPTSSAWVGATIAAGGAAAILALVGHNPGAAQLVLTLTGESTLSFPTSALAMIDIGPDWDRAVPSGGTLAGLWTPKGGSAVLRD